MYISSPSVVPIECPVQHLAPPLSSQYLRTVLRTVMALFHTIRSAALIRPPFALRGSTARSSQPYFVRRLSQQPAESARVGSSVNALHQLKSAPQPTLHVTWPHKGWDDGVVLDVIPSHREPVTVGDHFAWRLTKVCRYVT